MNLECHMEKKNAATSQSGDKEVAAILQLLWLLFVAKTCH